MLGDSWGKCLIINLDCHPNAERRVAKEVVGKRFGPHKVEQQDMLQSFIRHGLTQDEAESETLLQV